MSPKTGAARSLPRAAVFCLLLFYYHYTADCCCVCGKVKILSFKYYMRHFAQPKLGKMRKQTIFKCGYSYT